jgi:hypothetical protein
VVSIVGQPIGAQLDLERGLFARGVQRRPSGVFETRRDLQQQGRLANSGLAANQDHRARNDAAAEHEIEFIEAGFPARGAFPLHVAEAGRHGHTAAFSE